VYDSGLLKTRTYLIHVRMRSPMTTIGEDRDGRLSAEVLKMTKMRSRSSRGRGLRGYVICGTKSYLYDISATNPRLWCAVGLAHVRMTARSKNQLHIPLKKSLFHIFLGN